MRALTASVLLSLLAQAARAQEELVPTDSFVGERRGAATAVAGELAVLGAPVDAGISRAGRVLLFSRTRAGWQEETVLAPSDSQAFDGFGSALAADGDRIAVGAPHGAASAPRPGVVYVFECVGGAWVEQARLSPSDSTDGDGFGQALALDGELLLVGAPLRDEGTDPDAGAAYVFRLEASGWVEEARLAPADLAALDGFGRALALDAELACIGAPADDDLGGLSGSAYVFERVDGVWIERQKLLASDGSAIDRFGTSVGVSRERIAISAPLAADRGAVYAFERDAGSFQEVAKLEAADADFVDLFGVCLSLDGPVLAVAAPNEDEVAPEAGALYVFHRGANGWGEVAKLTQATAMSGDLLGFGCALEGDLLVAGAPGADAPELDSGAGFAFEAPLPEIGAPYCYGVAGACPCGNDSGLLRGCANSTGAGAGLVALGSASVMADDLRLRAVSLPRSQPALLFAGLNQINGGAGAPLGDGLRCAGGAIVRLGVERSSHTGVARFGAGLARLGGWAAGETRRFQCWYRDPTGGPCGSGTNLTNGVSLLFEP